MKVGSRERSRTICCALLFAVQLGLPISLCSGEMQEEQRTKTIPGKRLEPQGALSPEREMAAPADKIKTALTAVMLRNHYRVESESASEIAFSRELSGPELAPWILLGKRPLEPPRRIVRFSLTDRNGKTVSRARLETSGMAPELHRPDADARRESQEFRAEMQKVLDAVSASLLEAKTKAAPEESKPGPLIPSVRTGGD